ncbi:MULTISPECIES: PrsW family intramembrane metalloprotease [unclassified Microbacterium]|uniref:PrsW family intramembrane metalloprotease n=2 Tax=Microbacterium TaxID=33882 RepID=UPI000C4F6586|nr:MULTISPECIES: PrsW family intramembrane metalloprotease [unclassified Microbacterium]MAB19533.1 PrsW family intramembrane metalloprotease [Microbacterium sp.]MAM54395.1 PrsW family intramembrane metalloprotease [Microbacterium sp.]MAY51600.1 PrsW family intramembrane metalloprotease [Microbacterium sp.]HAS31617.1 PrsW family intramembrane metalloprotease [Microbacterium sp.]HBS74366.1 PrsW family intramembrane metalloprotease [Microbacterium sp.]|tara:strand:- start:4424 stop:5656 length:1233 start_codon:yes stop_codon:yes gene_type:complete
MTHSAPSSDPSRPSLTPPPFHSPFEQPDVASGAPIPRADAPAAPMPQGRAVSPRSGRSAPLWVLGVVVLVAVAVVGYFLNALGPVASVIGMILAFVPLAVVFFAVRIIDRWEPEPKGLVAAAIAWGAFVAIGITLGFDLALLFAFGPDSSFVADVVAPVVQAPIVEEVAKGLGVYVIFLSARRAFDGPVDGIVYGALVGAGFAFTENIQYFAVSFIEGGAADTTATFFVRGILSPFAHVMFTSVTGFALGLAARRGARAGAAFGPWLLGLGGAVLLHAFWNGSAVFGDFFALYLTLQVPLFIVFILGLVALRREEARLTRTRLADYAAAGWFTEQEVDMVATGRGRKAALQWAGTLRGDRTEIMKGFIRDATALAAARQRAISGRDPHAAQDEQVLLHRTTAARAAMFAP